MRALFTGSFDPVTNGHLDLIGRLVRLADHVIVGVATNPAKSPWFSVEERLALLRAVCAPWPTVAVARLDGLTVDAARALGADVLVRGVRGPEDVAYELGMAQANRALSGIETLLLPTDPALGFVSASLVREVARFGGDVTPFVPADVASAIAARRDTV
jgi:pantetheine-phosphate adenylyltransferase